MWSDFDFEKIQTVCPICVPLHYQTTQRISRSFTISVISVVFSRNLSVLSGSVEVGELIAQLNCIKLLCLSVWKVTHTTKQNIAKVLVVFNVPLKLSTGQLMIKQRSQLHYITLMENNDNTNKKFVCFFNCIQNVGLKCNSTMYILWC